MQISRYAKNQSEFENLIAFCDKSSLEGINNRDEIIKMIDEIIDLNIHFFPEIQDDSEVKQTLIKISDRFKELPAFPEAINFRKKLNLYIYNFPMRILEQKFPTEICHKIISIFAKINFQNLQKIACISHFWNNYTILEKKKVYVESKEKLTAEIKELLLDKERMAIHYLETIYVAPEKLENETLNFKSTLDEETIKKLIPIFKSAANMGSKIGLNIFQKSQIFKSALNNVLPK